MAYEAEMREIARRSNERWGELKEVVFLEKNRESYLVFENETIHTCKLPETDMLTFGYSGTGPGCFATFLAALDFDDCNVESVETPLKLTKKGKRINGIENDDQGIDWEDGSTFKL